MEVLLINKAIDGVLPDRMIELGSIEKRGGGSTVDHLLHPAGLSQHQGHYCIDLGRGGRHFGGAGLIVIDDELDILRLADNLFDQPLNLATGFVGLAGQLPHLVGHDGKAASSFPGSGCFYGRVEGQQIGLFRNTLYGRNKLVDGRRGGIELVDRLEATFGFTCDRMGPIGEAADGTAGLGEQLIQLRERALLFHQMFGTARQRFTHALQHLAPLVLARDHLVEEVTALPATALHLLILTYGGAQLGQRLQVLLLLETQGLPQLLIFHF